MPFESTSKTFIALGTMNTIQAFGSKNHRAVDMAADRVCEISDRMSVYHKGSDISRLNARAGMGPQTIQADTLSLLALARQYSQLTADSFDCTLRPLTALWNIGKSGMNIPSAEEIMASLKLTGYEDLAVYPEKSAAELMRHGMSVDLGGIAKGYAGDEVRRILTENGVTSALINLGGNIVTLGNNPDGSLWTIGIQNPLRPRGESLFSLECSDCSVVTSGSYERFFIKDSKRYHHILDPRTGYPAQSSILSVTVLCPSGVHADALSTALFVLGLKQYAEFGSLLLQNASAEAVYITERLELFLTPGLYGQHLAFGGVV
jgi:FAD:protein FMN transferase